MFNSRGLNNKINRLQETCLRIVNSENRPSFPSLLVKDKSVSIYVKNIQTLALVMLKVAKNLPAPIINETFGKRNVYDLQIMFTASRLCFT